MNEDLHALSGAYAVHALPELEGELFERHLVRCVACQGEVRRLRETAARLALPVALPPPAALRRRVLASAAEVRQAHTPATVHPWPLAESGATVWYPRAEPTGTLPFATGAAGPDRPGPQRTGATGAGSSPAPAAPGAPPEAGGPRPGRHGRAGSGAPGWRGRVAAGLAAVSAAAAVALGVLAVQGQQRLETVTADRQEALERQEDLLDVMAAPDVRILRRPVTAGGEATIVVSRERGRMVFAATGLPRLKEEEDYALWLMGPEGARPAGLLDDGDGMLRAVPEKGEARVALTVEPAGGSRRPTTMPIMLAELPSG
ncbi:anti-sigma factor domain-containing protein [Nonomuraea sp. NPDC059007]|uniref:anti-sigma factor domain-containing protein n=1 Tax=Nonomuraea sp. NPDC059007 TaxID=3346692 RepID=UPI00369C55C0